MYIDVIVLTEVNDVTIRRPHTTYICNGEEENFTQCNRSNPANFLCEEVGKVICEGIIHVHMNVYVHACISITHA